MRPLQRGTMPTIIMMCTMRCPLLERAGKLHTAYPEEILTIMPDVIISSYQQEAAEQLQNETGIPVVCVRYTSTDFINETFYTGMRLLAQVTGEAHGTL